MAAHKITIDASLLKSLHEDIEKDAQVALGKAVKRGMSSARNKFKDKYKKSSFPYNKWNAGFTSHALNENTWLIELKGEYAELFEDGGNIAAKLMKTQRAQKQGYLDIPMEENPSQAAIEVFDDLDQAANSFKKSDKRFSAKFREIKAKIKKNKETALIQSQQPKQAAKYMTIKRINAGSTWTVPSAGVFQGDWLVKTIENHFWDIFGR